MEDQRKEDAWFEAHRDDIEKIVRSCCFEPKNDPMSAFQEHDRNKWPDVTNGLFFNSASTCCCNDSINSPHNLNGDALFLLLLMLFVFPYKEIKERLGDDQNDSDSL